MNKHTLKGIAIGIALTTALHISGLVEASEVRLKGYFKDRGWWSDNAQWAKDRGLMTGRSEDEFGGDAPLTRGEMATILRTLSDKGFIGNRDSGVEGFAASNNFDGMSAQVGDNIVGMTITSLDIHLPEPMKELGPWGAIQFEGKVQISGTYTIEKNNDMYGEIVTFVVDKSSLGKLPKLINDERDLWFVFTNMEQAKDLFGNKGQQGEAIITIDNYFINYQEKDVYNSAMLVDVVG